MSTSQFPETTPPVAVEPERDRARKSMGVVFLLVVLTLGNVAALLLTISTLTDATDHGMDELVAPLAFSMVVTVVGFIGLGGAWATRKWGPLLYLAAIVVDRIFALVAFPDSVPPVAIVGVLLAVGLVSASRAW